MHAFTVRAFLAITAAALLNSGASLQASAQSDLPPSYESALSASDTEWPNQPGLYVTRWLPEGSNGMRTAIVNYSSVNGLLKCTPHMDQHNNEIETIGMIGGYSLREYMPMVPHYQKDVVVAKVASYLSCILFVMHRRELVHGNITPDTVYVRWNDAGDLRITLTGFEGSQPLLNVPQKSIVKPEGYSPPEDFVESRVYQRPRDAWMLGATLYFMANGHPPYGFEYSASHEAMLPISENELKKTMINREIKDLLQPRIALRAHASSIAFSRTFDMAENMTLGDILWERWDYLKSMLPIVGTPSWQATPPPKTRVEDNLTRYKTR
ncbi:hypothetical protein THASP1DRAFT_23324 [Thamnocephalis sphaerospora]|uniref:Protein kinase domain-containing protein n=1 Tax=Thamnocephalis sphaerospora TaxID=78915 RepID=A0A4P9XT90_9FUNG|nr:hypothetical protein THASP1DRAFT_23324 [Thamnocephalis sphaerospora]|eukprot:RKP08751.1 hypothetical protein THASP1DRAFT_23324 [Thamnocephalis sphaerospora]